MNSSSQPNLLFGILFGFVGCDDQREVSRENSISTHKNVDQCNGGTSSYTDTAICFVCRFKITKAKSIAGSRAKWLERRI